MQHRIPAADLGPHGDGMARAVSACVHCGFCLAACPTYKVMGEEMDSPRGRIVLMKQALEGDLRDSDARPYVDRCLGCLACETACPSGVQYRELLVPFRARLEGQAPRPWHRHLQRQLTLTTLESPRLFRLAHRAAQIGRRLGRTLPAPLRHMLQLLPPSLPASEPLPPFTPAQGKRRARVALLAGCVQQALRPGINTSTLRMLAANGIEVVVPPDQGCCGALASHIGHDSRARRLASHNRSVFPRDVDAIVTTAAGCGSAMKERHDEIPVVDIAELLDQVGLITSHALGKRTIVAYHDACHLSHGQGVRGAPRRLLQQVEGLVLAELTDGEMCCGSAGLYNLEQPDAATELGRRKVAAIAATGADVVATGNIGCIAQIEAHSRLQVRHTIEVLDWAIVPAHARSTHNTDTHSSKG